jgi:hypothetical protein
MTDILRIRNRHLTKIELSREIGVPVRVIERWVTIGKIPSIDGGKVLFDPDQVLEALCNSPICKSYLGQPVFVISQA